MHITSSDNDTSPNHRLWLDPLKRVDVHVYVEMVLPTYMFYTIQQLEKLHRLFAHPSADKLYKLLKRAGREHVTTETLKTLKKLQQRFKTCQRVANAPSHFKVSLGNEDTRFNRRVFIDIVYIDGREVLHVVDEATHMSAVGFISKRDTDSI